MACYTQPIRVITPIIMYYTIIVMLKIKVKILEYHETVYLYLKEFQ
jgi:hypothetical protein